MRIKALLVACIAVAAIGVSVFAGPASAGISECPESWVCLWQNELFTGRMLKFHDSGSWQNLTEYSFNDQASSAYNHTNKDSKLAINIEGGGAQLCIQPGEALGVLPSGWNNEASSIRIFTTATVC